MATAFGLFMAMVDVTVVNVALPALQSDLKASVSMLTWVVDAYNLSFAGLLLIGGGLSDRYGARRVYLWGVACFVAASLLCALSAQAWQVAAARLLLGAAAALFMPASLSLLNEAYPNPAKRSRAIGVWGALVSVAAAVGPFLGGVLVESAGWRSIFIVNLPLGLVAIGLSVVAVTPSLPNPRRVWTWGAQAVGVAGLAALCSALIEGGSLGWSSWTTIGLLGIGLSATTLFVVAEARAASALLPVSLFRNSRFAAANAIGFIINFAFFGSLFALSLFLQQVRGASPVAAGAQLLPLMGMFSVGNLLSARVASKVGQVWPLAGGLLLASLGTGTLLAVLGSTPYLAIASMLVVSGLGVSLAISTATTTVMLVAPEGQAGTAAAALNLNRQIGGLLGVAVAGSLVGGVGLLKGAHLYFGIAAAAYALGIVLAVAAVRAREL